LPQLSLNSGLFASNGVLPTSGTRTVAAVSLQTGALAALLGLPPAFLTTSTNSIGPASLSFYPISFQLTPTLNAVQTGIITPISMLDYKFDSPTNVTLNGTSMNGVTHVVFNPATDTLGIPFTGTPIHVTPSWHEILRLHNKVDLDVDLN